MRARVHDPGGPASLRVSLLVLGHALLFAGLFGTPGPVAWALLLVGALLAFPVAALTERMRAQDGEVTLAPGVVTISGAGALSQRLESSKLAGAFLASGPSGARVVIARAGRGRPPLTLELASAAEGRAVLAALGAGPLGFGKVRWEIGAPTLDGLYFTVAQVTGAAWILFALASWAAGDRTLAGVSFLVATTGILAHALLLLLRRVVDRPSLAMTAEGVEVARPRGGVKLPFASIVRVIPQKGAITFATSRPDLAALVRCSQFRFSPHAPTEEERTIVVEQLEAALERARAHAPSHVDAMAEIERSAGETAKSWLARLEVAAGRLLSPGAYRQGSLDEAALWEVVEDHDRAAALRVAAARVLVRVAPEASRARIGDVLASVRSPADRALLRVALEPDLDAAAREIEALAPTREAEESAID